MRNQIITFPVFGALLIIICASCSPTEDTSPEIQPENSSNIEVRARETLDLLVVENYTAVFARFNTTMKEAVPLTQVGAVWNSVLTNSGAFRAVRSKTTAGSGEVETWTFVCDFESGSWTVDISFNGAAEIVGLLIRPA